MSPSPLFSKHCGPSPPAEISPDVDPRSSLIAVDLHPLRLVPPGCERHPVDGLDPQLGGGDRRGLVELALRRLLPSSHIRRHPLAGESYREHRRLGASRVCTFAYPHVCAVDLFFCNFWKRIEDFLSIFKLNPSAEGEKNINPPISFYWLLLV